MRTLPANFSVGLTNTYKMFWCLKIGADSGNIYWLTANKNNNGSALTFLDVAAPLTYDSSILAKSINGREATPISETEQSIDLSMGGAIGSFSDMQFSFLNQHRLNEDLLALDLENRTATLLMGFIPDGTPLASADINDMITLWTGIVEQINHDSDELVISLINDAGRKHKNIPQTIIDEKNYPKAPKDSIGLPLPILYGDFQTVTITDKYYGRSYNLAPVICIDQTLNKFCIAGHVTKGYGDIYFRDGNMKVPAISGTIISGVITVPTRSLDDSGLSTFQYLAGTIAGFIYLPLSYAYESNNIADFYNAIDGDDSTYASVTNTAGKNLELCLDGLPEGATPKLLTFHDTVMYGVLDSALASNQSFLVSYVDDGGISGTPGVVNNGVTTFTISLGVLEFDDVAEMAKFTWRFYDNPAYTPAAETAKIKALGIDFCFIIATGITSTTVKINDREYGRSPLGGRY